MVSGGYRPDASQNDPFSVSPTGGNGQSGKFVEKKAAKAAQLRMSGLPQGENTAMAQQISQGGNVVTTASAANPQPQPSKAELMKQIFSGIETLDSEPTDYRPISDGVDIGPGRGSDILPPSLNPDNRQVENVDLIKKYLPDMLNAARMPGAPDSYKRMVNSLMRELM